jgi:hypothetical protein
VTGAVQFAEALLDARWRESYPGRADVPKPAILIENQPGIRQVSLTDRDDIVVRHGGTVDFSPVDLGWNSEKVEALVTIEIRTAESRERFEGTLTGAGLGTREEDGGLTGEVKRVLDSARKGAGEYDLVTAYQFNDLTGQMGGQVWRGDYTVRFEELARSIDPDAVQ